MYKWWWRTSRYWNRSIEHYLYFLIYVDDLTENRQKIKFSMIAADGTIFHKFISNQQSFDLGSAERMEILIKFN